MRVGGASRFPSHPAKRLTILMTERDHARHGSLMVALVQRARRAKLAGATAFKAREGYGASGRTHRTRVVYDDTPVTVVIVDRPERIDAFLVDVAGLLEDVLVTVEDIDVMEL